MGKTTIPFTKRKSIIFMLFVLTMLSVVAAQGTNETAAKELLRGEEAIAAMDKEGLVTLALEEALGKARQSYVEGQYADVFVIVSEIIKTKEKALVLSKELGILELRGYNLSRRGLAVEEAQEQLKLATQAMQQEDYTTAAVAIEKAREAFDKSETEQATAKTLRKAAGFNLIRFVQKYWPWMLLGGILLGILSYIGYKKYDREWTKRRIKLLIQTQKTLKILMKEAQTQYFLQQKISKQEYGIRMSQYRKRSLEVKRELPLLEAKLKNAQQRKLH